MQPDDPKGVMGAAYGVARREEPAVIYRYHTRALEAIEAVRRHRPLTGGVDLLDLGAADGGTMAAMAELLPAGSRFVGVEYSPELVALAPSPRAEFAVLQGNVARLPPSASHRQYDVVTALAVLEHLSEPERAFKNAAEVLRSQGLLVATCPAPAWDDIANRLNLLPDHHEARLSIRHLIALAVNAGLDVLETRRFMWAPVGILPHLHAHVSARRSFEMDGIVRRIRLLDWLFVNQLLVARKP